MKIDLVGPAQRGFAIGLNEFAGYAALAGAALLTARIAAHTALRPDPFYPGIVFVTLGFVLSFALVRETSAHAAAEARRPPSPFDRSSSDQPPTTGEIFWRTSLADRNLSSVSQAGRVNNLNDGMAWGLLPLFFAAADMSLDCIGTLAAIYPATWSVTQLITGALSDRFGRKWLIVAGMWAQAVAIGVVIKSSTLGGFAGGVVLLGIGTAMVYPTLLATIDDTAQPTWRASAVGVYRFWRDLGYAFGALLAGFRADAIGLNGAMWLIAGSR